MHFNLSPHVRAILQALFVTFLWSTSWVLIKLGLDAIPALTFAGTRYFLAFLVLLPLVVRPGHPVQNLHRAGYAAKWIPYLVGNPGRQRTQGR